MAGGGPGTDIGPLLHGRVSPRVPGGGAAPRRRPAESQPESHAHRALAGPVPGGPGPDPGSAPEGDRRSGLPGRAIRRGMADIAHPARTGHHAGRGRPGRSGGRTAARRPVTGTTVLTWAWGPGRRLDPRLPARAAGRGLMTGPASGRCTRCWPRMDRRYPHLRIGRSGRVFEALVPAVLEQKVVGAEARRAWRDADAQVRGAAAGPGPGRDAGLPARPYLGTDPSWAWHRAGVEGVRARTVIGAAHGRRSGWRRSPG
jgi:hypothetical protein